MTMLVRRRDGLPSAAHDRLARAPVVDHPGQSVGEDIAVSSARYARESVGDTLYTAQHWGALGIPWHTLGDCPVSVLQP